MFPAAPFPLTALRDAASALATRGVYIGTSSWKYEGWLGMLYDEQRYLHHGKLSKKRFQDNCLSEYAQTFRTVSVDAGYYQFPTGDSLRKLCDQVPDDFLFSFKVTDEITLRRFHAIDRHGAAAGTVNPHFLNAELFAEKFLAPCSAFRDKIGLLMFEFSTFRANDYDRGRHFVDDLARFLGKLPRNWQYGVEIRNESFLRPEYFDCLRAHGVAHIYNNWNRMPSVAQQMEIAGSETTDFVAARFLLKPGRGFEEAVNKFKPYRETREVNEEARQAFRKLSEKKTKRKSFLFVNNRLEGNSLKTMLGALGII